METAFLEWRRTAVLNVDLADVARRVVRDCLQVRPGETVLVMFTPQGIELGEAIQVEVQGVGARFRTKIWSRNTVLRTLDRHEPETLAELPFLDPELDGSLDAGVYVSSTMPQGAPPNDEQRAKLPHVLGAVARWHRSLLARRVRYVEVGLPHRGEFEIGLVTPEDAVGVFWDCMETDPGFLARRARRFLTAIGDRSSLHLRSEMGTDLEVELDLSRPHVGDGVISDDDVAAGRSFEELPAGALAFLPVVGTGDGTLVADYTFAGGRHFNHVRLEIRDGRIRQVEGAEEIRQRLTAESGAAATIAEVRIGLNPAGSALTGKATLDACFEGVVTVGFGNNELLGGNVHSTMHLNLPSRRVTASVGQTTVVEDGRILDEGFSR